MSVKKYMSGVHNSVKLIRNHDSGLPPEPIRTPSKTEQYAAELRRRIESKERTGTADDFLTVPLLDCEMNGVPSIPLLTWIFFNQLRPTMESLFYTRVPGTEEGLLLCQQRDSYDRCRYAVYGLIPFDGGIEYVKQATVALFGNNGHFSLPLFQSLPSSVFHEENWQSDAAIAFSSTFARILFRRAAASLWPANMATVCDHLRRYPDPWQRTLTEHATHESELDGAVQGRGNFDEAQFNEWFDLVTDPTHVEEERTIFRSDWQEEQVRHQKEHGVIMN
jgi:hypothetical protein